MEWHNLALIIIGGLLAPLKGWAAWKPKPMIEWVERQFVWRRFRITAGVVLLLLGGGAIAAAAVGEGWRVILVAILGGLLAIEGVLMLTYYDVLRNILLSFGELNDLTLRILGGVGALAGIILIILGILG